MPPKIDIEEVRRPIKKELEPINEKLDSLEEKYNTLSQTADFASALKYDQILKQLNNNNNNVFYLKNYKVYNTLSPANSYNANKAHTNSSTGVLLLEKKTKITTGGTVFIRLTALGAFIKILDLESGRLFEVGAYSRWALIRGWALIQINTVYTTYQDNFLKFSSNIQIIIFITNMRGSDLIFLRKLDTGKLTVLTECGIEFQIDTPILVKDSC